MHFFFFLLITCILKLLLDLGDPYATKSSYVAGSHNGSTWGLLRIVGLFVVTGKRGQVLSGCIKQLAYISLIESMNVNLLHFRAKHFSWSDTVS